MSARNVTALRKVTRDASHIYGKVEWAEGKHVTLRLVKEDVLFALRKDQSEDHPDYFEFKTDEDGAVYLGQAEPISQYVKDMAAAMLPKLKEQGIKLADENLDEMVEAFKHSLREAQASA